MRIARGALLETRLLDETGLAVGVHRAAHNKNNPGDDGDNNHKTDNAFHGQFSLVGCLYRLIVS